MDATSVKLSFEGGNAALAGKCAQELRKQILHQVPPGVSVSMEKQNPEAMEFGTAMVVHFAAGVIVETIFKIVEQYKRPPGMTLRVDLGDGKVALLDDVNPESVRSLLKFAGDEPKS